MTEELVNEGAGCRSPEAVRLNWFQPDVDQAVVSTSGAKFMRKGAVFTVNQVGNQK